MGILVVGWIPIQIGEVQNEDSAWAETCGKTDRLQNPEKQKSRLSLCSLASPILGGSLGCPFVGILARSLVRRSGIPGLSHATGTKRSNLHRNCIHSLGTFLLKPFLFSVLIRFFSSNTLLTAFFFLMKQYVPSRTDK